LAIISTALASAALAQSAPQTQSVAVPYTDATNPQILSRPDTTPQEVRRVDIQPGETGYVAQEYATRLTPVVPTPELFDSTTSPDGNGDPLSIDAFPPQSKVYYDLQNGVHWALGTNYKASAGPNGFTFVPFMGSDAPQIYPIRLQLGSVQLGSQALDLTPEASIVRDGERFVLDRGPVDVRYDFALDSVEQSFVLNAAGSQGDLRLRLDVDTELAWGETSQGLSWSNDRGGVTYQKAVVVDAKGTRLEIPIGVANHSIELTVPGQWLAQAVNPIVVDPILATYGIYSANDKTQLRPDVAYDFSNDCFLYVVQSNYATGDHDIRMEKYSGSGGYIAGGWVDFTSGNWNDPAIANDNATNTFLMVATYTDTTGDAVWCRSIEAGTLALSPTVQVGEAVTNSYQNLNPDVGGKSQGTSLFKVVWERDFYTQGFSGVRSTTVIPTNPHSTTVAPTVGATEFMTVDSTKSFTNPAISKSSGQAANAEWRVAFGSRELASGLDAINSARYADDNTLLHAYSPLYTISNNWTLLSVDVSDGLSAVPGPYNGDATYCIIGNFTGFYGPQIWWYGMDRDSYFDVQSITTREHQPISGISKYNGSIATSSDNFICSYMEWNPTLGVYYNYQTKFDLVSTGHFGVSERKLNLGSTPFITGYRTCCAGRFSGGNYSSRQTASAFGNWDGSVWRTRGNVSYQGFSPIAGYQYCTGNPNSTGDYGHIIAFGDPSVLGVKTLSATNMPLNQFGYFLAGEGGFGTITVSNGVQCLIGGPLGRYNQPLEVFFTAGTGTASLNIGPASYRGPGGNVTVFAGDVWNFQAWHRENGGASNFTDAVSITLE